MTKTVAVTPPTAQSVAANHVDGAGRATSGASAIATAAPPASSETPAVSAMAPMPGEAVLYAEALHKRYGQRVAVRDVSLHVYAGEIVGLLGPNGAGKTTTLRLIAGILKPEAGVVRLAGHDMHQSPRAAKRQLGVVPQELAIYEQLTPAQNLAYFAALAGVPRRQRAAHIAWALQIAQLHDRRDHPAREFSGGMQRRLNLACGIVGRPQLLLLDEPTVGVDPQSRNHIFEAVRQLARAGMAVVYTSHYMEEVEALCDRLAIVDGGAVVASGTAQSLIAAHANAGVSMEVTCTSTQAWQAVRAALVAHAVEVEALPDAALRVRIPPNAALAPIVAVIEPLGKIVTITSQKASLESVFLHLTGKALRDE